MISFNPALQSLRSWLGALPDFASLAGDRWEISPASPLLIQPAYCIDGQIDKIRGVVFATHDELLHSFKGGFETLEAPTVGLRFKHVDLVDGVLYAARSNRHLRPRQHRRPFYRHPVERLEGTLYESWNGNRWFGTWLMNDCLAHAVAADCGSPTTTAPKPSGGHMPRYEQLLGMQPQRVTDAHFDTLTLVEDRGNNQHKRLRAERMRERLVCSSSSSAPEPHPGVFLLRGRGGDRRVLRNELAIAEHLAHTRGFKVIDPVKCSVEQIAEACGGARVVAGVEGSHLVHGLMMLAPRATMFVIMPPERACAVLKLATDRQGQRFAFVVGNGGSEEFDLAVDDVERTLDLVPG